MYLLIGVSQMFIFNTENSDVEFVAINQNDVYLLEKKMLILMVLYPQDCFN